MANFNVDHKCNAGFQLMLFPQQTIAFLIALFYFFWLINVFLFE